MLLVKSIVLNKKNKRYVDRKIILIKKIQKNYF